MTERAQDAPAGTIRVAHSPDSDDAFMFYALANDRLDTGNLRFEHELSDIESLNRAKAAIDNGGFKDEVVPVTIKSRAGETQGAHGRCGEPGSAHLHELPTSDGHVCLHPNRRFSSGP